MNSRRKWIDEQLNFLALVHCWRFLDELHPKKKIFCLNPFSYLSLFIFYSHQSAAPNLQWEKEERSFSPPFNRLWSGILLPFFSIASCLYKNERKREDEISIGNAAITSLARLKRCYGLLSSLFYVQAVRKLQIFWEEQIRLKENP